MSCVAPVAKDRIVQKSRDGEQTPLKNPMGRPCERPIGMPVCVALRNYIFPLRMIFIRKPVPTFRDHALPDQAIQNVKPSKTA
jgi:hypothetical protein